MGLIAAVQQVVDSQDVPAGQDFQNWLDAGFPEADEMTVVVRIVNTEESRQLNRDYRHKDRSTNVLSFPFEVPENIPNSHLGDLVICAEVVSREAEEQGKSVSDHWAHMLVHGVLHLMGYDHIDPDEAEVMEAREIKLLQRLGISDPYV